MAHATHEDTKVIRRYIDEADFLKALDNAPPRIVDPRFWAYWNSRMGRYPEPPLPCGSWGDVARSERTCYTQRRPKAVR